VIRPATDDHLEAIAAITSHYIATSAIHFGDRPVTGAELAAQRAADPRHPWLVAVDGDRVVGYAKAGPWRSRAAYRWTCELGLYVAPGHHRRGLGRALYRTLIDEVTARGFHGAIGGITLPNPASVALHESLGFVHVGTVREAGWKLDRWHDVGFWHRTLRAGPPPA